MYECTLFLVPSFLCSLLYDWKADAHYKLHLFNMGLSKDMELNYFYFRLLPKTLNYSNINSVESV